MSAASAFPSVRTEARCSGVPPPPDAITGTGTDSAIIRVSGISYPSFVPSASIELSTISPAPSATAFCAHSRASSPVSTRPPLMKTLYPLGFETSRAASIPRTMHWFPKMRAPSRISSGFFTACEFKLTFSAPARIVERMSSIVVIPPPTQNGMNT